MDMLDQELLSQHPAQPLKRRGFIVTALGSGFALAVSPVGAQTITTDSDGLMAGPVSIPVSDGNLPAYRAQPAGRTDLPTVLVVQEIFGVHEHIKDLCRRLAKAGYLAIAPELYARQGDATKVESIPVLYETIVSKVPDAEVMSDLDSTAAWAKANNGSSSRVGITGFCWGGRITWLYCAHNPNIKAGAAWYGPLQPKPTALQPGVPIEIATELKCPVLGQYAGQDQGITADHVAAMIKALEAAKAPANQSNIIVYPDAQHGFNADYRPSYNKSDAQLGWQRMLEWFGPIRRDLTFATEGHAMWPLLFVLGSTLAVAIVSIVIASQLSFRYLAGFLERMISLSIGILLATAFLHLLPEAFGNRHQNGPLLAIMLAAIFGFFFLQKVALYRHDHHFEGDGHAHEHGHDAHEAGHGGALVLIGSAFHNFSDGVLIAGAYLAGPWVGLAATMSIMTHEVPHKIGDFMVLINAGIGKKRALMYASSASGCIVIGGLAGFFLLDRLTEWIPIVLVIAAANFIYISLSDLVPRMQRQQRPNEAAWQALMIGIGVAMVVVLNWLADV